MAAAERLHVTGRPSNSTHFVKPLPSSLMTIQQPGSNESSSSNLLTYSYLLLAILLLFLLARQISKLLLFRCEMGALPTQRSANILV